MYALGLDIGSSSIKVAIVDVARKKAVGTAQSPQEEMTIIAHHRGWAEQHPENWWNNVILATRDVLFDCGINGRDISSIGISYQMHGLVIVDDQHEVLRPSIIWCDSRAVDIGQRAAEQIGSEICLRKFLNAPGNFTASKLRWVQENEPEIYSRIHAVMLPGDYIAMKLSDEVHTTVSGLSEAILWDFEANDLAYDVLRQYHISPDLIPEIVPTVGHQSYLSQQAASELGLKEGTPISYRAGDQPNNALSLGVLHHDQVAATGGTSGVVYGVVKEARFDPHSRINSFAHVLHNTENINVGLLLCINGAGIDYAWTRKHIGKITYSYEEMENLAAEVPIGSDGISILPFGNGAERMLGNTDIGASMHNLQFNRHSEGHLYRASLEGIACAFVYGFQVLKDLGLSPKNIRAGNDNLFQSQIFSHTVSTLLDVNISLINTTGAIGAAQASMYGAGNVDSLESALSNLEVVASFSPDTAHKQKYVEMYDAWKSTLEQKLRAQRLTNN